MLQLYFFLTQSSCPVCSQNLGEVGDAFAQETHVKNCLEGGAGTPQATRYLVYPLRPESALIGVECMSSHPILRI